MNAGTAYFFLLNLLAVTAAVAIALSVAGRREGWRVLLVGTTAYLAIAHFTVLLLGSTGLLRAPVAIVLVGLVAVMSVVGNRKTFAAAGSAAQPAGDSETNPDDARFLPAAITLLAAVAGLRLAEAALGPTNLTGDTLAYKATVVAQWLVDGGFSLPASSYQAYYPFGAELISLWFMLPLGDDAYVTLVSACWLGLLAIGAFGLVRGSGGSPTGASLVAAALLASPKIADLAQAFAPSDLAGAALIVAATAMLVPTPGRSVSLGDLALAGLLAGLAAGCKVTYVLPAGLIFLFALYRTRRGPTPVSWLGASAAFVGVAALAGGYWFLRNWILAGNPVFPAELGPFQGPFDGDSQGRTKAIHWIAQGDFRSRHLLQILDWPRLLAIAAICGYAMTLRGWLLPRHSDSPGRGEGLGIETLAFAIGAIAALSFSFMPFSGSYNRPYTELILSERYMVLAPIFGLVLLGPRLRAGRGPGGAVLILLVAVAIGAALADLAAPGLAALLAAGALGAWIFAGTPRWLATGWRPAAAAAAILVTGGLALLHADKADRTARHLFRPFDGQDSVNAVWGEVDRLPPGSRIAFFMSEPSEYTHYYPIFGRSLQHSPLYLKGDGRPQVPLHARPMEMQGPWWSEWTQNDAGWLRHAPEVTGAEFVRRLEAAGADYAVTSTFSMGQWPPQEKLLEQSGSARVLYRNEQGTIWELIGEQSTGAAAAAD